MSPRKARRLPSEVPRRPRRAGRTPAGTSWTADGGDDDAPVRLGPPQVQDWPDG